MNTYLQRLTTHVLDEREDPRSSRQLYTVVWRCGTTSQGTLEIAVERHWADGRVIAELSAIRHLLEQRQVTGNTQTGKGLLLVVSQGAIRKLMRNRCSKQHLYPWALFLNTRFAGAACSVDVHCTWLTPRATLNLRKLTVTHPTRCEITVPGMGPVGITRHAWERVAKHLNYPPPETIWATLTDILTSNSLLPICADPTRQQRDLAWHGRAGQRFYDPKTKWVVVVLPEAQHFILVTAYLSIRHHLELGNTWFLPRRAIQKTVPHLPVRGSRQLALFTHSHQPSPE